MTNRRIPNEIVRSFERLASDSPIDALAASHELHRALATWQGSLVNEAITGGASWEDIGAALGTSKQGAWARFRVALGDKGGSKAMQDHRSAKRRARQVWDAGQARLRQMEASWHDEQQRLRDQLQEAKDNLAQSKRRHARERRDARDQLRKEMEAARSETS